MSRPGSTNENLIAREMTFLSESLILLNFAILLSVTFDWAGLCGLR